MPSYYNPYNFYPASYMPAQPIAQPQSFSQPQAPVQQNPKMMEWVEGEVGAKAFNMPSGWPANQPIPLWDSTDTIIWLKSWGPMGIPNPMQKLRYEITDQNNQAMLMSGSPAPEQPDMSQYVTKHDLDEFRKEFRNALNVNNQNGTNSVQNRSVNRNG